MKTELNATVWTGLLPETIIARLWPYLSQGFYYRLAAHLLEAKRNKNPRLAQEFLADWIRTKDSEDYTSAGAIAKFEALRQDVLAILEPVAA